MICSTSSAHTTIMPESEWAQFKAEHDKPGKPYCPRCDIRHEYDGRPYCVTARQFFAWKKARMSRDNG